MLKLVTDWTTSQEAALVKEENTLVPVSHNVPPTISPYVVRAVVYADFEGFLSQMMPYTISRLAKYNAYSALECYVRVVQVCQERRGRVEVPQMEKEMSTAEHMNTYKVGSSGRRACSLPISVETSPNVMAC